MPGDGINSIARSAAESPLAVTSAVPVAEFSECCLLHRFRRHEALTPPSAQKISAAEALAEGYFRHYRFSFSLSHARLSPAQPLLQAIGFFCFSPPYACFLHAFSIE